MRSHCLEKTPFPNSNMPFPPSLLLLFSLLSLAISEECSSTAKEGIRAHMTHVDSKSNLTKLESIRRSLDRNDRRKSRLTASSRSSSASRSSLQASAHSAGEAEAPVHPGEEEFIVDLAIGTPTTPFTAIVDTGSDLTWTQCKPCDGGGCYDQPTPMFDPSASSTFSKLPCSSPLCRALPVSDCRREQCAYTYSYGDNSVTRGVLASEALGFGNTTSTAVGGVGFGCGEASEGVGFKQASGLLGLGRGPLSLVSQLGFGKFSYCLTNFGDSNKSPLMLGSFAGLDGSGGVVQTTPLVKNPQQPSFYYLSLKGVSVGGARLKIPNSAFELNDDGTGGLIIDSGTSITYLEEEAYDQLKKAFLSKVKLPVADDATAVGLDLCFSAPKDASSEGVSVPKLVFHFDGADLDLPPTNYMVYDEGNGLLCLAVKGSDGMSIFGNFQQQNMHVLYDLQSEKLSFSPAQCDQI